MYVAISKTKHGHAPAKGKRRSSYSIWQSMNKRCHTPSDKRFKHYGGRGIKVCERWQGDDGFSNFLADMGEPKPGMSIERKDNDKGYCLDNCVWIPLVDQAKNRKYNWTVSIGGEVMTAREATRRLGLKKNVIATILRDGNFNKGDVIALESLGLVDNEEL